MKVFRLFLLLVVVVALAGCGGGGGGGGASSPAVPSVKGTAILSGATVKPVVAMCVVDENDGTLKTVGSGFKVTGLTGGLNDTRVPFCLPLPDVTAVPNPPGEPAQQVYLALFSDKDDNGVLDQSEELAECPYRLVHEGTAWHFQDSFQTVPSWGADPTNTGDNVVIDGTVVPE